MKLAMKIQSFVAPGFSGAVSTITIAICEN